MTAQNNGSVSVSNAAFWTRARVLGRCLGAITICAVPYLGLQRLVAPPVRPPGKTPDVADRWTNEPPPQPWPEKIVTTPLPGYPADIPVRTAPNPYLHNVAGSVPIGATVAPRGDVRSPTGFRWFVLRCGGPVRCWAGRGEVFLSSCRTDHPDEGCFAARSAERLRPPETAPLSRVVALTSAAASRI